MDQNDLEINFVTDICVISKKCNKISLPGKEGVFTILKNHESLVSDLKIGPSIIDDSIIFFVSSGIANICDNKVNIFAKFALEINKDVASHIEQTLLDIEHEKDKYIDESSKYYYKSKFEFFKEIESYISKVKFQFS